ncbi:MAG: 50S ribosomal protein L28 [Christensenellales bacterium]|jgi:large subunit ribosomal protein L28
MAKYCEICNKGIMSGNSVSHSNRKAKRALAPNIQPTRILVGGTPKRVDICTRCLRSGKVERVR